MKTSSSNYQTKLKVKAMCPILYAYGLIEGRWKTHILWAIKNKPLRFNEIRKAIPLATERMIARRLQDLLADELVKQIDHNNYKAYEVTKKGQLVLPILETMLKHGQLIQRAM